MRYDLQLNLLWNYTQITHLIPYRDIYYPYGLLRYFRLENNVISLCYYLIIPVLFTILYFILKKIIQERFYRYLFIAFIVFFVLRFSYFETFTRYGLFAVLSLFFTYVIYRYGKYSNNYTFLPGILIGVVMSLINDQGLYMFFVFLGLLAFDAIVKINKGVVFNRYFISAFIRKFLMLALGIFIGILPVLVYLYSRGGLVEFFQFPYIISQVAIVAKGPFFNYILYPDNRFTLTILLLAIFTVMIKLIFYRHKTSLFWYVEAALILALCILEQKSIIRSIDSQITFIAFILLLFLIYDFIVWFKLDKSHRLAGKIIYLALPLVVIMFWGLSPSSNLNTSINSMFNNFRDVYSNTCFNTGLMNSYSSKNNDYVKIVNLLKSQPIFNGKIYAYHPGDSTFYILLKQKPPYFDGVFEDNSVSTQEKMIQYIKANNIEYVTLDLSKDSLQDGVPHYIREPIEFKYILNNYSPWLIIGNHLILRKSSQDFFSEQLLNKISLYKKYLLSVNLAVIPFSEGFYKYRYFTLAPLIKTNNVTIINNFLKRQKMSSANKVFVLIPNKELKTVSQNYLNLRTSDGKETVIYFNACKVNKPCIIDLSNIPLFYKNRQISSLCVDNNFKGDIEIYNISLKILW